MREASRRVAAEALRMFTFEKKPSAAAVAERAVQLERIGEWAVAALLALLGRAVDVADLTVSEVKCLEAGCPPLETIVAELGTGEDGAMLKIPRALIDVREDDVVASADRVARGVESECRCGEILLAQRTKKPKRFNDGDAVAKAVQIAKAKPLVETTREDIGLMMRDAMRGVEFM